MMMRVVRAAAVAPVVMASTVVVEDVGLVLLQTSASKPPAVQDANALGDVLHGGLTGSQTVIDSISSGVQSVQQEMDTAQHDATSALIEQKHEYEAKLKDQHVKSVLIKHDVEELTSEVMTLKAYNKKKRARCEKIEVANAKLREQLLQLKDSMEAAEDFADISMNESMKMSDYRATKSLTILKELDDDEAVLNKYKEHEELVEGLGEKASMIQAGIFDDGDWQANDFLKKLATTIDDVKSEQATKAEALKEAFEKKFEEGELVQAKLLEEQEKLTAERTNATETKQKLDAAEEYLLGVHRGLKDQVIAVKAFSDGLGSDA